MQPDDSRKTETVDPHSCQMLKQSLVDEVKYASKGISEAKRCGIWRKELLLKATLCGLASLRCSAQPQPSFLKKMLADSEVILEDTKVELEADEECFMATKSACREKVATWSEYSRLRAKELQRMVEALLIFENANALHQMSTSAKSEKSREQNF